MPPTKPQGVVTATLTEFSPLDNSSGLFTPRIVLRTGGDERDFKDFVLGQDDK